MSTRLATAIAAGALGIGMLTGAAGAIVFGNATADRATDRHYEQMGRMMDDAGMGSMMEMTGGADTMGPGSDEHDAHHRGFDQ